MHLIEIKEQETGWYWIRSGSSLPPMGPFTTMIDAAESAKETFEDLSDLTYDIDEYGRIDDLLGPYADELRRTITRLEKRITVLQKQVKEVRTFINDSVEDVTAAGITTLPTIPNIKERNDDASKGNRNRDSVSGDQGRAQIDANYANAPPVDGVARERVGG